MSASNHDDPLSLALRELSAGRTLTRDHAGDVMHQVMDGTAPDAPLGALLMGLAVRGETVDEIAGLAHVMRDRSVRVELGAHAIDTCGTGGDGSDSFNISTVAAFVAAGAGARVAKHGNRAVSSACGSADVLEALGAELELSAAAVEETARRSGLGFMFAPAFHPAFRHAVPVRRALGVRTAFNMLGPLTSPAGVCRQVLGVGGAVGTERPLLMANVLRELGHHHALVVHGLDGLDEFSLCAPTVVHELHDTEVRTYEVTPEDVGLTRLADPSALRGGDAVENAAIARSVLSGEMSARRDVVLLNAAAACLVAGLAGDLREGVDVAARSIDDGAALAALDAFVAATVDLADQADEVVA
jgi:anthranilate phosphoribosyltransferase